MRCGSHNVDFILKLDGHLALERQNTSGRRREPAYTKVDGPRYFRQLVHSGIRMYRNHKIRFFAVEPNAVVVVFPFC